MRKLLFLALLPLMLLAQSDDDPPKRIKSPQEIQQELTDAEAELEKAKEMFAPYYTGPLVTPSPSMVPPGHYVPAPYFYVTDTYAAFDKNRDSHSLAHNRLQVLLLPVLVSVGITDTVDSTIVWGGEMNWQDGHFGGGVIDLSAGLGFLIQPQKIYVPQFKFTVQQTFPTGKYENLSQNGLGLNATGGGAYSTRFGLAMSKLLFWTTQHPVNVRFFAAYSLSTKVHVHNFNSYGGGFGTHGTVKPGNALTLDLGTEVSLTQKWVIANDIAYSASNSTKFHGNPGTTEPGGDIPAPIGSGYSDNLSLAPAIEYNWKPTMGIIFGAQFSVWGRNSGNFGSAVASWYGVF